MSSTAKWSFSDLRRKYGEEEALVRLSKMSGYGQFRHNRQGPEYATLDGVAQKDEAGCPICGQPILSRKGCWQ